MNFFIHRCDSSNNSIDYFRTDYFVCAPGTVFVQTNETFGFCLLSSDPSSCSADTTPGSGGSSSSSTDSSDVSTDAATTTQSTTVSTPPPPPLDCTVKNCPPKLENCETSDNLCPVGVLETPQTMTLCSKAKFECDFCQGKPDPCPEGEWFQKKPMWRMVNERVCFPAPSKNFLPLMIFIIKSLSLL